MSGTTIARVPFSAQQLGTGLTLYSATVDGWVYCIRRHVDGKQWTGWATPERAFDPQGGDFPHHVETGATRAVVFRRLSERATEA